MAEKKFENFAQERLELETVEQYAAIVGRENVSPLLLDLHKRATAALNKQMGFISKLGPREIAILCALAGALNDAQASAVKKTIPFKKPAEQPAAA